MIRAIRAQRDSLLARAADARPIDLPGVIGVYGVRSFVYVTEPVEVATAVAAVADLEPTSFVLILDTLSPALDRALLSCGWSFRRALEMMALPASAEVTTDDAPAPRVSVEELDAENEADALALVITAIGRHADLTGLADRSRGRGQLARDQSGQVLAFGSWTWAGDGAHINNIATREDRRGRGLGGLMTRCAVLSARRAGAELIYLESTDVGAGLYRRLGFETLNAWRVFERRSPGASHPGTGTDQRAARSC